VDILFKRQGTRDATCERLLLRNNRFRSEVDSSHRAPRFGDSKYPPLPARSRSSEENLIYESETCPGIPIPVT